LNLPQLYKEKDFLNHQFPTVTALSDPPTNYEGLLRCEKGEVKRLADQKVWPFTDYVEWQKFKLELSEEYPVKPPAVTWLTEVSHPNIVPNVPGAVCVSVLAEVWKPTLKLVSVVNSLYYLLSDPNPNNVFNHPKCLDAAKVCNKYGFPKMNKQQRKTSERDTVRFNIIPIPAIASIPPTQRDTVRFTILRPSRP